MARKLSRKERWLATATSAVLVALIAAIMYLASPKGRTGRWVTIAKDTTYITEPLRPDGYPDYAGALNQKAGKGVTPETNAAVLYWKAVGPGEIDKSRREKFFAAVGIPPLPEQGDYFVELKEFLDRVKPKHKPVAAPGESELDAAFRQYNAALERPWSSKEFPFLADWLSANEKPLALLVQASRRPRWYWPVGFGESGTLLGDYASPIHASPARVLAIRATRRATDGNVSDAWSDALACHRLARLMGQSPTAMGGLVANGLETYAMLAERALVGYANFTAREIAQMHDDLAKLPPMPKMVDKISFAERIAQLDVFVTMARERRIDFGEKNHQEAENKFQAIMQSAGMTAIDWDVVLRIINKWYDRIDAAARESDCVRQRKAMAKVQADIDALRRDFTLGKAMARLLTGPRRMISENMGQMFVSLMGSVDGGYLDSENRTTMNRALTDLAFALAAYRADHRAYPDDLADLTPKYISKIPNDIFNDRPLHYRREGGGFLLYSVGVNGRDDGGRGYEDRKNHEDWDDLTVRVTRP